MELELLPRLTGNKLHQWQELLQKAALTPDLETEQTALLWDGEQLVAAGSRAGNLLKCIAVDPLRRGEDLTATVLTALRKDAFDAGHRHLFLYTKPINRFLFSSLFFYPIAASDRVLLMEDKRDGIREFLSTLPEDHGGGTVGACVMNCNPFTWGHRHLIETAARECDRVYVFVLSEEKSAFPAADRLRLVQEGTADLKNVTVLPTGPYLISSATFPTYFLKDREQAGEAQCMLDVEIFAKYYAPRFSITRRYVAEEPLSPLTAQYNAALREHLPQKGITLVEIPRLEREGTPISASAVRRHLADGEWEQLEKLVPPTTLNYLKGE
ncbi:MAG: [Clostridia bacterium]|nr:[citrate (pro-3S)-lyase] ligase [Clostridia bacterium]